MTGPRAVSKRHLDLHKWKIDAAGSEGAGPAAKYANLGDGVSGVRLA
jgi:hypothetical protein